jgi:hypothetical protein
MEGMEGPAAPARDSVRAWDDPGCKSNIPFCCTICHCRTSTTPHYSSVNITEHRLHNSHTTPPLSWPPMHNQKVQGPSGSGSRSRAFSQCPFRASLSAAHGLDSSQNPTSSWLNDSFVDQVGNFDFHCDYSLSLWATFPIDQKLVPTHNRV